jgi:tripartite-type tricarboxylate transporter receptor subunit TctC
MASLIAVLQASALGFALTVASAVQVAADVWPQRTVRVIVPNPPGIANDVIARLFAERLSSKWGQPVIVENLPGPDGLVAAREFTTRKDGHTLLYSFAALLSINPLTIDKLPYDPARDLVPIASTSDNFIAIAVSNSLQATSLSDLSRLARERPSKLSFAATPGIPYYAFAAFQREAGFEMTQIPYRDFNQAITDLGEGRIDVVAAGLVPLLPQARAGRIRMLALVNGARSSAAPDIPTLAEQGFPSLKFSAVTGFFGSRDMPLSLRDRIAEDVRAIVSESEVRDRLAKLGSTAYGTAPDQFTAAIAAQREQMAAILRQIPKADTPKQ